MLNGMASSVMQVCDGTMPNDMSTTWLGWISWSCVQNRPLNEINCIFLFIWLRSVNVMAFLFIPVTIAGSNKAWIDHGSEPNSVLLTENTHVSLRATFNP